MTRISIYILLFIVLLSILLIHSAKAQDVTPPASPEGLRIVSNMSNLLIAWDANTEPDLAGYNIYHSVNDDTNFSQLVSVSGDTTSYTIEGLPAGTHFLAVTAFDTSDNESVPSSTVSVDIASVCGDGMVSPDEGCDDGNTSSDDGCSDMCLVESGWVCDIPGEPCRQITCGDGMVGPDEGCDDGNLEDGDGCSSACLVEEPLPTIDVVPTLSQWGLVALAAIFGIVSYIVVRRKAAV